MDNKDAIVDPWHCDAGDVYSDVRHPGFDSSGQKFLRGYQVTDQDGVARFATYEFTSQLFFTDSLTDTVHAQQPYAARG